jgi:hypothetical protein
MYLIVPEPTVFLQWCRIRKTKVESENIFLSVLMVGVRRGHMRTLCCCGVVGSKGRSAFLFQRIEHIERIALFIRHHPLLKVFEVYKNEVFCVSINEIYTTVSSLSSHPWNTQKKSYRICW